MANFCAIEGQFYTAVFDLKSPEEVIHKTFFLQIKREMPRSFHKNATFQPFFIQNCIDIEDDNKLYVSVQRWILTKQKILGLACNEEQ